MNESKEDLRCYIFTVHRQIRVIATNAAYARIIAKDMIKEIAAADNLVIQLTNDVEYKHRNS